MGRLRFLLFSLSNKTEINLLVAYLFLHFVQTLGRRLAVKTSSCKVRTKSDAIKRSC